MNTCYAMVLEAPDKFVRKQFPIPDVDKDSMLLKIEMVSICGSDRKLVKGSHKQSTFPKILGHEFVGHIVKIGDRAREEQGVGMGSRVTVEPYVGCASCEYCLSGNYQAHIPLTCYGVGGFDCTQPPYLFGGYAEYVYLQKGTKVYTMNDDVPAEAACLSSVIANGIRWVHTRGKLTFGESVTVIGPGSQGLATVIAAKEAGAYPIIVIGITKDIFRLDLAKKFGADYTINLETESVTEKIKEYNGGKLTDLVVECAGVPSSINMALELVQTCGRVTFSGLTGGKEVLLKTDRIVNDEISVFGGHGQAWNVEGACKLLNSRKYSIENIITHRFALNEVGDAMKLFFEAPPECVRIGLIP